MAEVAGVLVNGEVEYRSRLVPGLCILRVAPGTEAPSLEALEAMPLRMYSHRSVLAQMHTTDPDDPWFLDGTQWYHRNVGQTVGGVTGTPGADIRTPCAWDVRTDASEIIVAVIDYGVNYLHPDLAANMWTNAGEAPPLDHDGLDNDGNGWVDDYHGVGVDGGCNFYFPMSDPFDSVNCSTHEPLCDGGHGTQIASVIGGRGSNANRGTGVAWNAKIMPIRYAGFDVELRICGGSDVAAAIKALDYAAFNGAKIINTSFAFLASEPEIGAYHDACKSLANLDVLLVASAGNQGIDIDGPAGPGDQVYPARFTLPNILIVGNSTQNDLPYSGLGASSYGQSSVDLFAAGTNIRAFHEGGPPTFVFGTSFAAPVVAGVAALVWAEEPTRSAVDVAERIKNSARPVGALSSLCVTGGVVDAGAALGATCPP